VLELDDIQHFLIARPPALAARYEFLSFRRAEGARAWLAGIRAKVGTAQAVGSSPLDARWVTVAFTWNGLKALGVDDESLTTFPEEFRQGMAARANILGTTGANHPDHWIGGVASPNLHAIVVLFARNVEERERCTREHQEYLSRCAGAEALSSLDLEALPPFGYPREHFGYHDRLSQPVIDGTGVEPTPGSGPSIKAGEFFLGYPDEEGEPAGLPRPAILSLNGSYLAYVRLEEHVGAFRDFLRQQGETQEQ
jgi:deferrochelatase/peroxidase EfeB